MSKVDIVKKSSSETIKEFLSKTIKPKLNEFKSSIDTIDIIKGKDGKYYLVKHIGGINKKICQIEGLREQEFKNLLEEFKKLKENIKKELNSLKANIDEDKKDKENLKKQLYLLKLLSKESDVVVVKSELEKYGLKIDFSIWYTQLKQTIADQLINGKISMDTLKKEVGEQFIKDVILYILNKKRKEILDLQRKFLLSWKKNIQNWSELSADIKYSLEDVAFLRALNGVYPSNCLYIILTGIGIKDSKNFVNKFGSFNLDQKHVKLLNEYINFYKENSSLRQYRLALEDFDKTDGFVEKVISGNVTKQDFKNIWSSIERKGLFGGVDYVMDRLELHTKVSSGEAQFLRYLSKVAVLIGVIKIVWNGLGKIKGLNSWWKKLLALGGLDIFYNIGTGHHLWEFSWKLFTGDFTKDYYMPFYKGGEEYKQRKEVAKIVKEFAEDKNVDIIEIVSKSIPDIEKVSLIAMWFADMKLEKFLSYKEKDGWNIDGLKQFLKSKSNDGLYYYIFEKLIQDREARVYFKSCLDSTYKYFVNYSNKKQTLGEIYRQFNKRYKELIKEKEKLKRYLNYDCGRDRSCMEIKQKLHGYLKDIKNNYLVFKIDSLGVIKSKYRYQDILSYLDKLMSSNNMSNNTNQTNQTKTTQSGQNLTKTSSSTSTNSSFSGKSGIL